ncbi:hypothetical protein ACFVUS_29240 [Nocardia sp. NPDC058058]|uniref:hypothetical protein n=1 Tax=Nocardia sp. NPDC058058 TaxID=3346317 RepID=UPI0036DEDE68
MQWTYGADPNGVLSISDILPEADRRADWSRVRALFEQQIRIADSGGTTPAELRDAFSDAVEQIATSYTDREADLALHALAVLGDVECAEFIDDALRRKHYDDDRFGRDTVAEGRRRPSPYEAIVETCRRVRDARQLCMALRGTGTSGLLIGSVSYGRYHNVRGNRLGTSASDLDCLVIAQDSEILDRITTGIAAVPGLTAAEVDRFDDRTRLFRRDFDDGKTVFSHKFRLWSDTTPDAVLPITVAPVEYQLSLHIMSLPVLERILVSGTPRLLRELMGVRRTVRDYRQTQATRQDEVFDFSGRRDASPLDADEVEGGWLIAPRVYHLDQFDSYFPGFYQTMLFPRPTTLWDELGIAAVIDEFQRKISERLRYEATRRPSTLLRHDFAHVRRTVFAPSVIRSLQSRDHSS